MGSGAEFVFLFRAVESDTRKTAQIEMELRKLRAERERWKKAARPELLRRNQQLHQSAVNIQVMLLAHALVRVVHECMSAWRLVAWRATELRAKQAALQKLVVLVGSAHH